MMKKWYNNNIKLFFLILFLAPLGLYGLIKRKTRKTLLKVFSIIVTSGYILLYFILVFGIGATLIIGNDKIYYDSGETSFAQGDYEKALENYQKVKSDSKLYMYAKQKISDAKDSIFLEKQRRLAILEEEEKNRKIQEEKEVEIRKSILGHREYWADSIVKSWKGNFIISYEKPITDTINFILSKNASLNFSSNREMNLPVYRKSYLNSMTSKFGENYSDIAVIEFVQNLEAKQQIQAENARKEKIYQQFSSWDGSHRQLERVIKNNMNDPNSYDHIETTYTDKGSYLMVYTKFRGKNAFGALVVNTIQAKVDLSGNVMEIK